MKYTIIASLIFDTPAKRDSISQTITDFIASKLTWGLLQNSKAVSIDGKPSHLLTIRFENKADMTALFDIIKDKMLKLPVLKGAITTHECSHDEPKVKPCIISDQYEKV